MQCLTAKIPFSCSNVCRSRFSLVRAAATPKAVEFSNSIGAHALVFAGDWSEPSAQRAAAGAAAAGYDLVEIAAFNAAKLDADMTKRVFAEHSLQAACSLGLTPDADISNDSAEVCWGLQQQY